MAGPECRLHSGSRKGGRLHQPVPPLYPTVLNSKPLFYYQLIHLLSLIGNCLTHIKNSRRKAARHLVPIIEERYRLPPDERPNDLLSWLMEDAVGEDKDPYDLTLRILAVNFAAIHATSTVSCFILTYMSLTLHFPSRCSSQRCINSWLSKS